MPPAQDVMASVSVAPQPQRSAPSLGSISSNLERRPSDVSVLPPPNPPFVFPPRRGSADESHTPLPLPPFSFNPGHIHTPKPSTSSTAGAPRPVNHRRQPSEFVGDAPPSPRLSASTEVGPPSNSASLPPPGPGMSSRGPGRRGHAHRRSGALSSIDLNAVTKAGGVGSAPISPANRSPLPDDMSRPGSRSTSALGQPSPPASPVIQSTHLHPGYRNTIAVGERTRPSSMVSTDTGDSLSTIRPGHSRSSSANPSVLLGSASSSSAAKQRPKTADASLLLSPPTIDLTSAGRPRSSLSHEITIERGPSEEEGEPSEKDDRKKSKKKKKKKNKKRGGASRRSSEKQQPQQEDGESSEDKWESASSTHSHSESESELAAMTKKLHKKQKKVRSWAGSILTLKTKKTRVKKPVAGPNSPARPVLKRTDSDLASLAVDFDQDNTVIIRTPTNPDAPKPAEPAVPSTPDPFESSWKPRSFYEQTMENEGMSPVIDLDAALGPFNTPEMGTPRVAGSAFLQASKRMYSGGRRGEFVGPEMRYHRRAESAPEMPPFDRSAFGFSRLGPDASMAHEDVFYEEEEDAFLANNQSPTSSRSATNSNRVSSVEADRQAMPSSSETVDTVVKNSEAGDKKDDESQVDAKEPHQESSQETVQKPSDNSSENSQKTQQQEDMEPSEAEDGPGDAIEHEPAAAVPETSRAEPARSVEIVEQEDWPARLPAVTNPEFSPPMVPVDKRPSSSPMDVNPLVPRLSLPRQPSSGSPFPSPDPSNMSLDGPRSATASSMTDQTTFNHPFHEQSVEDVPSLTSSVSTRTNLRGRISAFYNRTSEERFSAFSHTRPPGSRSSDSHSAKRSSLVSLSRLVGAAHGERSKLSFEAKPSRDDAERAKRKSNRISRLMFWRSKDKHRPNDEAK
ncbi:hypothetical protein VTN49DRAFT_2893 [Thermomyces lanuginosus]|uniref:uncharacterized protein n=1 Tax=Thermomyces lanuginosus TaxID=5541 RepID=UPI0037429F68